MADWNGQVRQLKQIWAKLNPRQRVMVGGGTALTIALVAGFAALMSSPDYKPLMVGLDAADVPAITAQLAAKNIPSRVGKDGKSIEVPAGQIDAARLQVSSESGPHSGRLGFELFDKVSWGQTEFDERVNYQRALEGELERTIGTLSDVKAARVHLVMARDSVFLDKERGAKASVTLRLKHGSPSREELKAIARLVSGAVDNLSPADVAIIDADSSETLGSPGGSGSESETEQELTRRLVATLAPVVGPDNLRASVNVEYDLSSSEESQDKYDPAVSAVLTTQRSEEQTGAGAGTGGVPGTASNLPTSNGGGTQPVAIEDGAQSSKSENSTFGVNKIVRHTVSPAGRVKRITAAVLVNDVVERKQVKGKWTEQTRKRSPAELKQMSELAMAATGMDASRGDVISVQNMTFDRSALADTGPPSAVERVRRGLADFSGVVRYAGLFALFALAWALIFRPLQKGVLASIKELPGAAAVNALPGTAPAGLAIPTREMALEGGLDTAVLKQELIDRVQAEPAAMTRSVQAWLREDPA